MTDLQQMQQLMDFIRGLQAPSRSSRKGRKKGKGGGRRKLTDAEKAAYRAQNTAECIRVFKAAGYDDVQPYVNVLPYGGGRNPGWLEHGRKVKTGEKAIRVNNFPLFHYDQTEPFGDTAIAVETA